MLILTRRIGETIVIGSDVTVTITGIKGNQVRLGISAPKTVPVHRREIYRRLRQTPQDATNSLDCQPELAGAGR